MQGALRTAVVVAALAAALAGCGGSGGTQPGGFTYESTLTVYSDLPLQGPQGALMTSIDDGEILALRDAHARGEDSNVSLALLNDADSSGWNAKTTADAARQAGQDLDAIAYIGDFDSGATAVAQTITNENNILQVSPASPYAGLTDSGPFDQPAEPQSYYPDGKRTLARLVPSDAKEAVAVASFMHDLGVDRLFTLSDGEPYDGQIAALVGATAPAHGVALAGSARIPSPAADASLIAKLAASHVNAVFVGAAPQASVVALWSRLHAQLPAVKLFAPSTLATGPFLAAIAGAADTTFVTSPILPLSQYPAQAQAVLRAYRRAFATAPSAWSLYGYEAMASVLVAIQRAHANPNRRLDVVADYFALGERHSVIGDYRIDSNGDTSLARFGGYRVGAGGKLIERRSLSG
jgi:branched-chain amino acid transport system substrate-binding protein